MAVGFSTRKPILSRVAFIRHHAGGIIEAWWIGLQKPVRMNDWEYFYSTTQSITPNYPLPVVVTPC